MASFPRRAVGLVFSGAVGGYAFRQRQWQESHLGGSNNPNDRNGNAEISNSSLWPLLWMGRDQQASSPIAHAMGGGAEATASSDSAAVAVVVAGVRRDDLPDFDLETIAKHTSSSSNGRIYVTYKAGVYDITDFIEQHPGGRKRIMLAAGGSIEKFWAQITIHNDDGVRTILESMRIGNVKGYDPTKKNGGLGGGGGGIGGNAVDGEDDEVARLWAAEPFRSAALGVVAKRPFNAQAPEAGMDTFLTSNDLFFVRNHMPVPLIPEDAVEGAVPLAAEAEADNNNNNNNNNNGTSQAEGTSAEESSSSSSSAHQQQPPFCLQVEGLTIVRPQCFTLAQLKALFKEHTVATTIECGGNRRSEMGPVAAALGKPNVKGLSWQNGAISTAEWSGYLLSDVVAYCRRIDVETGGGDDENNNVTTITTATDIEEDKDRKRKMEPLADDCTSTAAAPSHVQFQGADSDVAGHFAVSVPIGMAIEDADRPTLIACKMNGEPIPRDHGYPLRAIVPGTVGVRNCKWLTKVSLTAEEAQTVWQQNDYKNFPVYSTKPDKSLPSVYAMPVTSAITEATLMEGERTVAVTTTTGAAEAASPPTADVAATSPTDGPAGDDHNNLPTTTTRTVPTYHIGVKGYAYVGSGAGIQRVELSVDGGKTFVQSAAVYKRDHPITLSAEDGEVENGTVTVSSSSSSAESPPPSFLSKRSLGLPTGTSNVTADMQFNHERGSGDDASSSSPSSSTTAGAPPQLLTTRKDWTWSLFSAVVDVTDVPPTTMKEPSSSSSAAPTSDTGSSSAPSASSSSSPAPCWTVCSRAVTNDNAAQPPLGTYNFRGLLYNGYSCREVCAAGAEEE